MIYICSEIWVRNRHGYRLVSDNFETLDAPDYSVEQLIQDKRLDPAFKTMNLPIHTLGSKVVGGNKLVVLRREGFNIICADYLGVRKVLSEVELDNWEFVNGHIVEFTRLGGILSKTVQLYNETYKSVVDSYYNDSIMEVDTEAVRKAQLKAEMVQGFYSVDENGLLNVADNVSHPQIFKIPNGVKRTTRIDGFTKLIGCESLIEIILGQKNEVVDLSKCTNLITVKFERVWNKKESCIKDIIWSDSTINIEGYIHLDVDTGEFTDWKSLKLCPKLFEGATMNKLKLGNSYSTSETCALLAQGAVIKTIELGGNIKTVGEKSFMETEFTDIILGDSIEEIGDEAFHTLRAGEGRIYGGANLKNVGKCAFSGCVNTTVDFSNFKNLRNIGTDAFGSCKSATNRIVLSESVRVVGKYALPKAETYVLSSNLTSKSIKNILESSEAKVIEIPRKFEHEVAEIARNSINLTLELKINKLEIRFI